MKKEEYIACKAEITDWDEKIYELLVTDQLDTKQVDYITQPHQTFPRQEVVFAIHWHP